MSKIMTLQEKQALLAEKSKAAVEQFRERAEIALIDTKINMLSNEAYMVSRVKLEIQQNTMTKLKELETQCEMIVNDMPIYSAKIKESRKWNPSRQYGMGPQMDILTGLLTGIQYSAAQHKEQMLAITGLSDVLVENTLAALGNTAYYSRNYGVIVDEIPYNIDDLRECLDILQDTLNIKLDLNRVTNKVLSHRFEVARLRAERELAEDVKTQELSGLSLDV